MKSLRETSTINRVSESVQHISLNARDHAAGIGQVSHAIESINSGAQQATKGLTESSEGLHALNRVVAKLQSMVGMTNAHR